MKSQRQLQVGESIKRNMSEIFLRDDILSIPGSYITILEADVSPDIKNVKFYIDIFGNDKMHEKIIEKLNEAAPHFRHLLAKRMTTRVVPEITFILDRTASNVSSIESLLDSEAKKYQKIEAKETKSKKTTAVKRKKKNDE